MAKVYYFPRYKGGENSVTNTVLHLFAQIYSYSPYKLYKILSLLIDPEMPFSGLTIEQQVGGKGSIPDGLIRQEPLTIKIETKVDAKLTKPQLKRHCKSFPPGAKYLLVLTKEPGDKATVRELNKEYKDVHIVHRDFVELNDIISEEFYEYELQIKPIVEDFFEFCSELDLLPKEGVLRAVPSGGSFEINKKYNCYNHPATRGYSPHEYLGLYKEKSVRMIGKVSVIVDVKEKNDTIIFDEPSLGKIDDNIKNRILGAIQETKSELKWDIHKEGNRFFCVDKFYETDYKKTTKGGMQINRYLNILDYLEKGADIEQLAAKLREKGWS